jgi:hypothetical protein
VARPTPTVRRVGSLAVRVLVVALVLLAGYHGTTGSFVAADAGWTLVRASNPDPWGQFRRSQMEYIRAEFYRQVPVTTTIYVADKDSLWAQRLVEFAAMGRYRLVPEHDADVLLYVDKAPEFKYEVRLRVVDQR